MRTVLVTCVGSGVGQSAIDSLNIKREFKIIGCDGNPNVYAHSFCDQFFEVPGIYTDEYIEHILQLCIDNNVEVLIPGHDHELTLFAKDYKKFEDKGIKVIVSEPKIIAISRDKQDWYDFFAPLGCKIVPTTSVKEFLENPDETLFPAIVKPSGGSASQGISIVNQLSELENLKGEDIIQPYLFPEETDKNYQNIVNAVKKRNFVQLSEVSVQLIFNKQSIFTGIFISKNSLKNGVPVYVDPIDLDEFEYTSEILKFVPILEEHKVRGPVNIQGRVTPKGLLFFEMNMRFTGITGNRALLGFNEVDYLVRDALSIQNTELKSNAVNKVGVRQVACTTIPRQTQAGLSKKEVLTVLGGGSEVGKHFINKHYDNFEKIFLICRKESLESYSEIFKNYINVKIVEEKDVNATEYLCQSDVFINFVSALAYEDDVKKFEAIQFVHYWMNKVTKAKVPFVLNLSSQSVYPQQDNEEKDETYPTEIHSTYAFQKKMIEVFVEQVKEYSVYSTVINIRAARILNPKNKKQLGFFGEIVDKVKSGDSFSISHPSNNTNLIHISDVADAILYFIQFKDRTMLPKLINLGGENLSMEDYVEVAEGVMGKKANVIWGDNGKITSSSCLEINRMNDLGFFIKFKLKDIISEI